MKKIKKLLPIFLSISFMITLISCKSKKQDELITVRLNEVVRSVFYAPLYVAINNGFFEEEGLKIDLSTGQGADKTMQQVLSKNADIGFCGPEQAIYIYNQGKEDYAIVFANLTQKDGSFLVSRSTEKDFDFESLKGKTIIGGRPGGMPEMTLEYVLKSHNIDPKSDVNLITNLAYTATAGAFQGGMGDYCALFEPSASTLEDQGSFKIVKSIGDSCGTIPYTSFFTTKSYMEKNPKVLESFSKAILKGQLWVNENSDEDVSEAISSFFPGIDEKILKNVIKNYKSVNAFANTPVIKEDDYNRLLEIIDSYDSNLLPKKPNFNELFNNSFAEKAVQSISK